MSGTHFISGMSKARSRFYRSGRSKNPNTEYSRYLQYLEIADAMDIAFAAWNDYFLTFEKRIALEMAQFKKREFLRYKMTDEVKQQMMRAFDELDDPFSLLTDFIRAGYKMSMTFNEKSDSFITSATPTRMSDRNDDFILSAFHSEPLKSLFELWFVHFVWSGGDWSNIQAESLSDW